MEAVRGDPRKCKVASENPARGLVTGGEGPEGVVDKTEEEVEEGTEEGTGVVGVLARRPVEGIM